MDESHSEESAVPESSETAFLPVAWHVDPEELRNMTPEQRQTYDIEVAEKMARLSDGMQEIGVILAAAGIKYEGESPRTIIDRILNPDKEEYRKIPGSS